MCWRYMKVILVTISYALFFILVVFFINRIFFPGLLNPQNFLHWDSEYYDLIKSYGYEGRRVAFFPLFPMVWRGLSTGIYGIAIANSLIFISSFITLCLILKVKPLEAILYMSIPSFFFFYLPYSESVFFACCVLLIAGLKTKNHLAVLAGLFFASVSRPAFTVFVPAYIITEIIISKADKNFVLRILSFMGVALAGFLVVGLIQHWYTTEWFTSFSAQKYWDNKLRIPKFPLTSWSDGKIIRLDGSALLFGTISAITILVLLYRVKSEKMINIPAEVVFSLSYLAGISASVLLFRGGSLFSLNRFFFAVPFIIVVTHYWLSKGPALTIRQLMIIFFLISAFWLLFSSYSHIQTFLRYLFLTIYMLLVFIMRLEVPAARRVSLFLMIILNFSFQIFFCIKFLNGGWVG